MAFIVIEMTSAAQRDEYKKTAEYAEHIAGATNVDEGLTPNVTEADEEGTEKVVDIHWVLIENEKDEDNVTLRVNDQGTAEFWATGVEV